MAKSSSGFTSIPIFGTSVFLNVEGSFSRNGIPPDTLEDEVEPFLLRCGFIQRTPRGRVITAAGLMHMGHKPDLPATQPRLF